MCSSDYRGDLRPLSFDSEDGRFVLFFNVMDCPYAQDLPHRPFIPQLSNFRPFPFQATPYENAIEWNPLSGHKLFFDKSCRTVEGSLQAAE